MRKYKVTGNFTIKVSIDEIIEADNEELAAEKIGDSLTHRIKNFTHLEIIDSEIYADEIEA